MIEKRVPYPISIIIFITTRPGISVFQLVIAAEVALLVCLDNSRVWLRRANKTGTALQYLVSFPDPPVLEGLVYKVGIFGCADSAVVCKLRVTEPDNHVIRYVPD